jgi:anti-anti-sigma factor
LTVRGEIDIATAPRLQTALDQAIRESAGPFVLDLCEPQFLDSSGLGLLLRARAALARDARPLAIVCPPGPDRVSARTRSTGDGTRGRRRVLAAL